MTPGLWWPGRLVAACSDGPFLDNSIECPKCGVKVQDVCGLHSLCCARGESTKGHYCVRDRVLELVHLADSSVVTEVKQLSPDAPNLRLADIFTAAALPGRMTAFGRWHLLSRRV